MFRMPRELVLVARCRDQSQPTRALVRGVARSVFGETGNLYAQPFTLAKLMWRPNHHSFRSSCSRCPPRATLFRMRTPSVLAWRALARLCYTGFFLQCVSGGGRRADRPHEVAGEPREPRERGGGSRADRPQVSHVSHVSGGGRRAGRPQVSHVSHVSGWGRRAFILT